MKALLFLLTFMLQSSIMPQNNLTPEEQYVILQKGTEHPFTGKLLHIQAKGTYVCKQCGAPLYRSESKFDGHCGWPSFDDEIAGAVLRTPDPDGVRTEISCAKCGGHLGHVFLNEGFTAKNTRHCVNSISMKFIPDEPAAFQKAWFASGCFWGTEYHFNKAKGVIETTVGFMGGHLDHPSYRQVCTGETGHLETTEVVFDPQQTSYEELVKLFLRDARLHAARRAGSRHRIAIPLGHFLCQRRAEGYCRKIYRDTNREGLPCSNDVAPCLHLLAG
jgi:peptide methionine sulfoxide reductase msrA/msrB